MERNIKLTIEYCGTGYCGWQIQENGPTVQGAVEKGLSELTGERIQVTGCSRTDAGVHADNFVLNFKTASTIPADRFAPALNSFLPGDVVAKHSEPAHDPFHARYDAKYKTYRYFFHIAPFPSANLRGKVWEIKLPGPRDLPAGVFQTKLDRLSRAASFFEGTHDFTAFRAEGSNVKSTVRTVTGTGVFPVQMPVFTENPLLCFEIRGDGFLYNMVRIMAGTLIDIYKEKILPEDVPEIIRSKDRTRAGMTAPPDGLYLHKVEY